MAGSGGVEAKSHGLELDYVGLVCRDVGEGADWVASYTGVAPTVIEPRPMDRYAGAVLRLGPDTVLEVMGPAPGRRWWHPASLLMAGVWPPRVLVWYVATDDFAGLIDRAARQGVDLSRVEHTDTGAGSGGSSYSRAQIGRRPRTAVPGIIEWHDRVLPGGLDDRCRLTGWSVAHPEADAINATLAGLGVATRLTSGPHRVSLTLDCPQGAVTVDQPGFTPTPASVASLLTAGLRHHRLGP